MARARVTFDSRLDTARQRMQAEPEKALKLLGPVLVKDIKSNTPKGRSGRLQKSIGSWYRRQQKDLQIGSKSFYASLVEQGTIYNSARSFLKNTIMSRLDVIQEYIKDALKELSRR